MLRGRANPVSPVFLVSWKLKWSLIEINYANEVIRMNVFKRQNNSPEIFCCTEFSLRQLSNFTKIYSDLIIWHVRLHWVTWGMSMA